MRRLLVQGLARDGHEVAVAEDGRVASGLIEGGAADVAVLDVRMPGRSGLDVLRAARERGVDVAFVLITGFGDAGVHDEALRLGALRVLDKPFDLDELRELLHRIADDGERAGANDATDVARPRVDD